MKRTLNEELKRIHKLSYGDNIVEQSVFDKLLKTIGVRNTEKKVDDPKRADFVSSDVNEFFKTLQDSAKVGLSQQSMGSMTYQKGVETMQIGLMLLGYDLPRYGIDGLFGPETASAVKRFNLKNRILNESGESLRSTIKTLGYDEKGNEITSGGDISNKISSIVSEILKEFKTLKPDVMVVVTSGNDAYHKKLSYNSIHKTGNAVDVVLKPYNSDNSNTFLSLLKKYSQKDSNFKFIDEYNNPSKASTGGHFHLQYGGNKVSAKSGGKEPRVMTSATPEMLNRLIELLKERGVKPEELKNYIDKSVKVFDVTSENVYTKILQGVGAPVTDENMKFLLAWRQAEGKGGRFNPFNTTYKLPNSTDFNKSKVKNYDSLQDGVIATIKTLKNSRYTCIVDGLKNNIGAENIAKCQSLKVWGTGDLVSQVLSSYNRGKQPKIEPLV